MGSSTISDDDDENEHAEVSYDFPTEGPSPQPQPQPQISSWYSNLQSHVKILLFGQVLSLSLAMGGAAQATLHLDCGLSAPTFTMATVYLLLSFHLIVLWWRQRKVLVRQGQGNDDGLLHHHENQPEYSFLGLSLHRPVWQYLIIAVLDVEANAITMLAFRYTTLTSVSLFDALAIPSAMIVSKYFLGRQYTWVHLLGALVCMAGVVFNVMQDYEADDSNSTSAQEEHRDYPHKLRGDILAITGGILYGLNDVLAEVSVRHNGDTVEYLGVMGFLAFGISLIQSLLLEWDDILAFFGRDPEESSTCSLSMGWGLLGIFVGVITLGYMGVSRFLMLSEAAFLSLSFLTGDIWSVVFSIVAERIVPNPLFFVALAFVLSGVVLYEMAPHPVVEDQMASVNINAAAERLAQIDNDFELHEAHSSDEDDDDDDNEML
jgi:solute carrier family 35 protein F1/2